MRVPCNYVPTELQRPAYESTARFVGLWGGVRAGKSTTGAARFLRLIARDLAVGKGDPMAAATGDRKRPARLRFWVVSPDFRLADEAYSTLRKLLPDDWIESWTPSDRVLRLKGGVRVDFRSAERPETLVAAGISGLWIDEAARIPSGDVWRGQLYGRLLENHGWAVLSSTPYGGRQSWVFKDFIVAARSDPTIACFTLPSVSNPVVPVAAVEAMRRQLPPKYFAREALAEWDSFSGAVFDEYSPAVHVVTRAEVERQYKATLEQLSGRRCLAGVDWGFTSPGSIIVATVLPEEMLVVDELYESGLLVADLNVNSRARTWVSEAKRLRDQWAVETFYADPSRPDNIMTFGSAGISCIGARNSIPQGLRLVAERLHPDGATKRPRMRIVNTCVNLLREMESYSWATDRNGDPLEEPDPAASDHALDSLRYVVAEVDAFAPRQPLRSVGPDGLRALGSGLWGG